MTTKKRTNAFKAQTLQQVLREDKTLEKRPDRCLDKGVH